MKDEVFRKKIAKVTDFKFNNDVASVFDDMVSRSIPFYDEIHRIINDILGKSKFQNDGLIYDIGCSTGTTIMLMDNFLKSQNRKAKFIGIDPSNPMIAKADQKLSSNDVRDFELICNDASEIDYAKADIFIVNYTMQFIPLAKRKRLLKKIHSSLKKGGIIIMSEKINCLDRNIHLLQTELYYDFKRRNGYSELEISQKRDALENVLKPLTPSKNLQMLKDAGFKKSDMLFRWYNFACFIGIK